MVNVQSLAKKDQTSKKADQRLLSEPRVVVIVPFPILQVACFPLKDCLQANDAIIV